MDNQTNIIDAGYKPNLRQQDKLLIAVSHLAIFLAFPILIPLVIYLVTRGDSPVVARNAAEALNFHISLMIYTFLCVPLVWIIIGVPLMFAIVASGFIFAVIAAIKSTSGEDYRYPLTIRLV